MSSPKGYEFDNETSDRFLDLGEERFQFSNNPNEIIPDSDIVYTDVWTSMGQEEEKNKRLQDFKGYQVNSNLLDMAKPTVKFMHDLPAHPGEEIEDGLLYDSRSVVFDQAENRLWAQTGLMEYIFSNL